MSGQEGEGEGSEEEIKDSLLRQWKEGRLQVAEEKGRQIPTIIERRSLPKRQSWPLLSSQPPAALLPDLSQPPPGFQHLQPGQQNPIYPSQHHLCYNRPKSELNASRNKPKFFHHLLYVLYSFVRFVNPASRETLSGRSGNRVTKP